MVTWDARMRQTSHRTCVRCGDARGTPLLARRTTSSFFFFVSRYASTWSRREPICAKLGWFAPIRPNIGVFRPEKENRPVREKKKKLKPKIPRRYRGHNLTLPFFSLEPSIRSILFCFFLLISFVFVFWKGLLNAFVNNSALFVLCASDQTRDWAPSSFLFFFWKLHLF